MKFAFTLWLNYVANTRILVNLPHVGLLNRVQGLIQLGRAYVVVGDLNACQTRAYLVKATGLALLNK
jgi:hypothetical protein